MKAAIKRAVRGVVHRSGLVSRASAEAAAQALERAHAKIAELKAEVNAAHATIARLKTDQKKAQGVADELTAARADIASLRQELQQTTQQRDAATAAAADVRRAKSDEHLARMDKELRAIQGMEEKHRAMVAGLQETSARSEQSMWNARNQLMALEVKLDVIEGALTVVDTRTKRALLASEGTHSGDADRAGQLSDHPLEP